MCICIVMYFNAQSYKSNNFFCKVKELSDGTEDPV